MTAGELHDRLIATLVRQVGGDRRKWRRAIGPLRLHDLATHPHCNWSVDPRGSVGENDAIERLLDRMRLEVPIVTAD